MMLDGRVGSAELFGFLSHRRCGQVAGVFSSGVYFLMEDKMLLLHDEAYGVLPFGIAVPGLEGRARSLGLEPGMDMELGGGLLRAEKAGFELRLCFENTEENPAPFSSLSVFAVKAQAALEIEPRSALSVYGLCSLETLDKGSIEDIFAATAYTGLSALLRAMESVDEVAMASALKKLLGLGRGLTPSLDDFICAMLFSFHYARRCWGVKLPCLSALSDTVKKLAPERTNLYSAAYLLSSADGGDFSIMRRCLESSMDDGFVGHAEALMKVGGSSGADMLSGMCFAANYILKQRQVTL